VEAFCSTTGLIKFYHSGKTYTISSVTGTQQGVPLGGILFTAPLQPLFNQIADTFPDILICVFADNTVFLGPQAQALAAADLFNTLLAAAHLALNPIESNILLTNTINWLHKHPIAFNWLQQPLLQTLVSFENLNIISLQQWNLPVATISPSPEIRDKQSLPLQIPSASVISDWPAHSNTG
jgi:hypothetical protein